MIKNSQNIRNRRNLLQPNKRLTPYLMAKTECFLLRGEDGRNICFLPFLFHIGTMQLGKKREYKHNDWE